MNVQPTVPATIPFHIAKAYGVAPAAQQLRTPQQSAAAATSASQKVQKSQSVNAAAANASTGPVAGVGAASKPEAAGKLSPIGARLVGAVVPGKIDFSGDTPRQAAPTMSIYRHPADKNAAATGVIVGRTLDMQG